MVVGWLVDLHVIDGRVVGAAYYVVACMYALCR